MQGKDWSFIFKLPDASETLINEVRRYLKVETVKDLRGFANNPSYYPYVAVFDNGNIREFNAPWELQTSGQPYNTVWPEEAPQAIDPFVNGIKEGRYYYHYTKVESALKILQSNKLKFGKISTMDDLYESTQMLFVEGDSFDKLNKAQNELDNYQQISLVTDYEKGRKYRRKGFDILPMWGCYAEKGNGVCLVLDKNIIGKELEKQGLRSHRPVRYGNYDNTVHLQTNNPQKEIARKYKSFFFTKQPEWSFEQEYRIVKRCESKDQEFLPLADSIKAIIIANTERSTSVHNSLRYQIFSRLFPHVPIFIYGIGNGFRSLHFGHGEMLWLRKHMEEEYWSHPGDGKWELDESTES